MSAEVQGMLVLSTAHLSERTARFLIETDHTKWPALGGSVGGRGWFFQVQADGPPGSVTDYFEDLFGAFRFAAAKGCRVVRFSDDQQPSDSLPIYRPYETARDRYIYRRYSTVSEDASALYAEARKLLDGARDHFKGGGYMDSMPRNLALALERTTEEYTSWYFHQLEKLDREGFDFRQIHGLLYDAAGRGNGGDNHPPEVGAEAVRNALLSLTAIWNPDGY
jgi:hypothetical protein